ncbi:MAG: TRAP transporter large permease subunit [Betaproteobacteria bacterium]|nr:MAG: TRAP transporter large permease subunit [Betaproteobacteria bacterium]
MAEFGLALLGVAALLVATTGLPVFAVLLVASCVGATVGVVSGAIPLALLGALPSRMIGLLENDLLQAVPLFVFIGALLDRLPLADLLYRGGCRLAGRSGASPRLAAMGLSALLAPMNGSVGASVAMLARVVAPRLRARGVDVAQTTALVSVASTLGVLVPPSIVLLLLGDAMMSAHTQALNVSAAQNRIINTQDLLHGVLGPAAIVLLLLSLIAAWQARRAPPAEPTPLGRSEAAIATLTVAVIGALLGGVAAGWFYAVEAAACGGVLLLVGGVVSGRLGFGPLNGALRDALDITGSLCALFVSATTFTLLLRSLGTDVLVTAAFARLPGGPAATVAAALAVLLLCGLVLDAYELIFVVVPILMPPVLTRVDDALWVAVLSLLALQMSFLLPPLGYAVMMSGARIVPHPTLRQLVRALTPYLLGLAAVLALVLAQPRLVHLLDAPAAAARPLRPDEVERVMRAAPRGVEP